MLLFFVQEAYKQWVCAMYLPPLQVEGEGVKPCRYICRLVEQRCPYFHPSVKDQYAGERVFKCIDPDIPDLDGVEDASSYGPPHRCYCPQHLGGPDSGEEECRLLTPAQLRRKGQHGSSGTSKPTDRADRPSVHGTLLTRQRLLSPTGPFLESGAATCLHRKPLYICAYIPGPTRLLGFKQSVVRKVPGKRDELVEELLGKKRDELVSLPRSSKDAGSVEEQTDGQLLAVHSP
ncbi:uncharacterized protein CDAR_508421 [Caerostris darwini]|uniref:Uncharacterized protein n=1 Tax=Caerostris darwini TaxID=1538125 RepID=A0AAV4WQI0_9ARAC|nr:uncharacterized protein CDAR_508421 [Caerostris darwini]